MFSFLFISELTQIVADVAQDPTLPRTTQHPCPKWVYPCNLYDLTLAWNSHLPYMVCCFFRCNHKEAVFFQSQSRKAEVGVCVCHIFIFKAYVISFMLLFLWSSYVCPCTSVLCTCMCMCVSVCLSTSVCMCTYMNKRIIVVLYLIWYVSFGSVHFFCAHPGRNEIVLRLYQ